MIEIVLTLQDSLVSSHVYEIIKTVYTTSTSDSDQARISVLINTLIQLRLVNIATLDALMTHFTRLIELTSADEEYVVQLATNLAPCILRPRTENAMTLEEKHAYRLIRDLFAHKDAIFSELKRAASSTLGHSASVEGRRPRAISTDESSRKANMEARQKAILAAAPSLSQPHEGARSRATSPAPSPRGHRRDRSSGGPGTRFPVNVTSPTSATDKTRQSVGSVVNRNSLDVPSSEGSSTNEPTPSNGTTLDYTPMKSVPLQDTVNDDTNGVEKRNSLGRGRLTQARKVAPGKGSVGSISKEDRPVGVSLTDAPMDD